MQNKPTAPPQDAQVADAARTPQIVVQAVTEIRSLTGLRGVAALYVVLQHLLYGRDATGPLVQRLLSKGYLAVDVFFVLSGLVMALTYHRPSAATYTLASHADFLLRRAARILPLYLCVLALSIAAFAWQGQLFSTPTLLGNIVLLQCWGLSIQPIVTPSWSISTEAAAYLAFPLLCLPTLRSTWPAALASLGAAYACVGLATVLVTPDARALMHGTLDVWDNMTLGPLLRCLGGFTLGLLMFRLSSTTAVRRLARSDLAGGTILALLLAGIVGGFPDLVLYPLFPALVLACYVGEGAESRRGWLASALGSGPLHQLGVLSYAIYLVHSLIIAWLWPASQAWLTFETVRTRGVASAVLCLGTILLCAVVLHTLVEKPGRSWVRRLAGAAPGRPALPASRSA